LEPIIVTQERIAVGLGARAAVAGHRRTAWIYRSVRENADRPPNGIRWC